MFKFARPLAGLGASCFLGLIVLIATASSGQAQEIAGPFERFLGFQLEAVDALVVVLASAATIMIASYEFARDRVTILDVPTMPKYTVSRTTYWSFNVLYVAIVFLVFVVVMERYETLRQLLIAQDDLFAQLPSGDGVLTISIGSVALVAAFHYLHLPRSQIGPSWLLFQLRRGLHKRARIPEEAQALANEFLSDSPTVFTVPDDRIEAVVDHPRTHSVAAADFGAGRKTIDYQWAVVSYLYMIGADCRAAPPFSSFVSNDASLWSTIEVAYAQLAPRVATVKSGGGDEAMQIDIREKISSLRVTLGIFHACLNLFAISNDAERAARLKDIGLKHHAVFFIVGRNLVSKFLVFIVCGIAVPPLAFGLFSRLTGDESFKAFAEPALLAKWVLLGTPMYLLPIAMVLVLKRLMRASWPIRATRASVEDDPTSRHRADFKWDIYLLVFVLSFAIAALPLIVNGMVFGSQASLYFALAPASAATSLAVLIDFDVVDRGRDEGGHEFRRWVLATRAAGFAVLLGGIVSWLASTLTDASIPNLVVYAVTAAFMGVMIGLRTDFDRNVRVV